jgi:hypothetical protein
MQSRRFGNATLHAYRVFGEAFLSAESRTYCSWATIDRSSALPTGVTVRTPAPPNGVLEVPLYLFSGGVCLFFILTCQTLRKPTALHFGLLSTTGRIRGVSAREHGGVHTIGARR